MSLTRRELVITCGASGYVALYEISIGTVFVLAVRHQLEDDTTEIRQDCGGHAAPTSISGSLRDHFRLAFGSLLVHQFWSDLVRFSINSGREEPVEVEEGMSTG